MTAVEAVAAKLKTSQFGYTIVTTLYLYNVTDYHYYYYYYYSINIAAILGRRVARPSQHNITITSITIYYNCVIIVVTHIFSVYWHNRRLIYTHQFLSSRVYDDGCITIQWAQNIDDECVQSVCERVVCVCSILCTQSGVTYRTLQRFTKRISLSLSLSLCIYIILLLYTRTVTNALLASKMQINFQPHYLSSSTCPRSRPILILRPFLTYVRYIINALEINYSIYSPTRKMERKCET